MQSNLQELGEESDNFGGPTADHREKASSYYNIAQKTSEVVVSKLGYCGRENHEKFNSYLIVAAYDPMGNLQGVSVMRHVGKKGAAAKNHYSGFGKKSNDCLR